MGPPPFLVGSRTKAPGYAGGSFNHHGHAAINVTTFRYHRRNDRGHNRCHDRGRNRGRDLDR